jgi:DedD protein
MEEKLKQMRQRTNDLSDIVLEKESKKTENTKKWLLTAASMILLFLIILIIMKMLNKPESTMNEEIAQVGESVETLVPDDMQESPTEATENLFKKEPIIDETTETDLKFEEMVRKLKEQDRIEEPTVEKLPEVKEEVVAVAEKKEVKPQEVKKEVKEVKPQEIKPVVQVVPEEIVAPVTKPAPKKVVQKIAPLYPKETKIPSISGYFIQVGATAKSFPDKRFLQKIKRAGFDYIVHGVTIKGKHIKKVLVGPYTTRDGAKNALAAVKANINPSAYIYRIK